MTRTRPLMDGLFREAEGRPVLVGSHCEDCGRTYFPQVDACLDCLGAALATVDLPTTGTLFSYTQVHVKSPNFGPGHMVGYVDLPGGLRVFAPLREMEAQAAEAGLPVRLEIVPLWRDAEDTDVLGYCFVPDQSGTAGQPSHA